ncbi:flavin monoamine oxidase family protein [Halalkalibacter akibai]|nr:FAD-dependent oxidoreductase [Halalkalibacter akibai]
MKETDVVIIGAGLAGLTAAIELKKKKVPFVVLEARNRAGGRVYSLQKEDIQVDLGAQWISPHHKRMKKLLRKYDLHLVSTYRQGKTIYNFDGIIQQNTSPWPNMSVVERLDIWKMKKVLNDKSKSFEAKAPWEFKIAQELDKITVEQLINHHMYTSFGKSFYQLMLEEALCSKLFEVSALDLLWCIRAAGSVERLLTAEDLWIKEGVGTLVEKMARSLPGQIEYEQPVTSINSEFKETIITTSKQIWKAKKVILALPPNLLTHIKFIPILPVTRAQLNERAGLPSVMKMVFIFNKPFWRDVGLNGNVYSNEGPIKLTVDTSPPLKNKGVLTVLITGESARLLSEKTIEQRKQTIIENLVHYFGEKAEDTLNIIEKDWSAEEWTRGGYGAHFSPGVLSQFGVTLSKPVGPLHWAGTETATEWRMYMEGAVQSGERVAEEIVQALKHECKV